MIPDGIKQLITLAEIFRKCKLNKMKIVYKFIYLFVLVVIVACTNDSVRNLSTDDNNSNNRKNSSSASRPGNKVEAIGPFVWGMTDDSFWKLHSEWINELKVGSFIELYGVKIKSNGVTPHYDNKGHLDGIDIEFERFYILTDANLSDKELTEFNNNFVLYNKKIEGLICGLSDVYGEPIKNDFKVDSYNIFNSDNKAELVEWKEADTNVVLEYKNSTINNALGCDFKMTLYIKRIIEKQEK